MTASVTGREVCARLVSTIQLLLTHILPASFKDTPCQVYRRDELLKYTIRVKIGPKHGTLVSYQGVNSTHRSISAAFPPKESANESISLGE